MNTAFENLKEALCSASCLALPDWNKTFQCVVDASATGVGGVLMQSRRPIAFLRKRLNQAERNYSTSDRELLAAVKCLKEWRVYLSSTPPSGKRNKLITDHQPNVTVLTKKDLSSRQCRWMEIFQEFPLTWLYEKGESNIADPLSRLPENKEAAILSLNVFRTAVIKEFLQDSPNFTQLYSMYIVPTDMLESINTPHVTDFPVELAPVDYSVVGWFGQLAILDAFSVLPSDLPHNLSFCNISILHPAHLAPSTAPTYHFHNLTLNPTNMSMLEERPEDVLDACQTELQQDLVAALTKASALPESKVIAQEMESLTFTNGLFWTKDGKMWVPDDKDLRYQVFLDCHASVLAGHMGRDKTDDQI